MRIARSTLIGTAVAMALFGRNSHAADAPAAPSSSNEPGALEEIVVTGIRRSTEESLEAKRAATSVQEVVSAEDIGKMPDKNVADSLARVPGVTISSASANEGGFDENDRVSMRGTNPSLTQTLVNGHGIAAGDWFVLSQVTQVGRSVSYTLLPSELVSQVVVHKSSQASLVEGGVAGSVDIITRKPLDFNKPLTFQASAGAVYAELPSKTDPQFSALLNWKNDASNVGLLLQGFYEARHLRRDGVEILGYEQIQPGSAVALAHPDLANVYYPVEIGAAFFEQKRERTGGLIDFEVKPTDNLNFDLSGFFSKLDATNFNRNYMQWLTHVVNLGAGQGPDPGYVVTNGTLTKANFSGVPGTLYGVYDQISRPEESATSGFVSLDSQWRATDTLSFSGQIGWSQGDGKTPTQNVSETSPDNGLGAGYQLNGLGRAPDFNFGSTNNTTPFPGGTPVAFNWIFGAQNIDVKDRETWAKLDSDYTVKEGVWEDLKFGARYQTHERSSLGVIGQGPTAAGQLASAYPSTFVHYPSDFNSFGSSIPSGIWYWTPAQLAAYNSPANVNRDPVTREYFPNEFEVREHNTAGYVQADFKGSNWSGDIGVRFVRTQEHTVTMVQVTNANTPGAVTTSAFGNFVPTPVDHTYNDILPSANLKYDLTADLVARFAVAKTMTRADYSALSGGLNLTPPGAGCTPAPDCYVQQHIFGSGSGSNPDLKPIRSTNYDASLEWYFAKRSLLSAGLFYMDLQNYVSFGSITQNIMTFSGTSQQGQLVPYVLSVPVNAKGRVQGAELAWQQALGEYFGIQANYTYADGKQTSLVGTNGDDRLVGTSKNTYNISGYFENARFSARVNYTYRSAFFSGLDRNSAFSQDAIGNLSASLQYTITDNFSVTLDGENLNNPTLKYYALNTNQPRAFYRNGSQYYLTVRAKF